LKEFRTWCATQVDILFANESEIMALWETEDYNQAVAITRQSCDPSRH